MRARGLRCEKATEKEGRGKSQLRRERKSTGVGVFTFQQTGHSSLPRKIEMRVIAGLQLRKINQKV